MISEFWNTYLDGNWQAFGAGVISGFIAGWSFGITCCGIKTLYRRHQQKKNAKFCQSLVKKAGNFYDAAGNMYCAYCHAENKASKLTTIKGVHFCPVCNREFNQRIAGPGL